MQEKEYQAKREQISSSIEVAFEDTDTTDLAKLRSCDKQLEGMREVKLEVSTIDALADKLGLDSENRMATIMALDEQIAVEQQAFSDIEKLDKGVVIGTPCQIASVDRYLKHNKKRDGDHLRLFVI